MMKRYLFLIFLILTVPANGLAWFVEEFDPIEEAATTPGKQGSAAKAGAAGSAYTDPTTGMEMVWVPGRCFQMGSPGGEEGRDGDEGPVHEVCVDGLYMGKYEVTNRQYRLFQASHASKEYGGNTLNGDNQPVVNVSWEEATGYGQRLSRQSGNTFRLPTEAEWEYAARAGTTTVRYWGDDPDNVCKYANVNDKTSKRKNNFSWAYHDCDDGYAVTAPVGSFKANNFGLYDMIGNVWEWTGDWYGDTYYSSSPRNNPNGPSSGSYRVIRGGGWNSIPWYSRAAFRSRDAPSNRRGVLGFRLVLPPGQQD